MINKIHIIGCPGTGKSTIAKIIASKINSKVYDLDNIIWVSKYDKKRSVEQKIKLLNKIVKNKKWVIEGVSRSWIKNSLDRADLIIFLDLPIKVVTLRLVKRYLHRRYIKRIKDKERLKDNIKLARLSHKLMKESENEIYSFKWIIRKYKKKIVHLKSQEEIDKFLKSKFINFL